MMSASTGPTRAVSRERTDLSDTIISVRCAVEDVEQWLEGEDALSALVRNVALQLEAVRRAQLLQEQEIHGRNSELHELHNMLQALLSDGQAQSRSILELQARLDGHNQTSEAECAGTKLATESAEHQTLAIETSVQRLNLLEQRLACVEHRLASEYCEKHASAAMDAGSRRSTSPADTPASKGTSEQCNWASDVRRRLDNFAEDIGRRLDKLDSGMELHGKQLNSLQAAHMKLVDEVSERGGPCHSEVMSHFALFVKKEDACKQHAALEDRITCLERATVGSLQGTSLNFHPGRRGTAGDRSTAAAEGLMRTASEETQKVRLETEQGMEAARERWAGPEVHWTSTSVERSHSPSLAAGAAALAQPPRHAEPMACLTQQEWHPCSISPRCNVGTTAALRSLSSSAIECRGRAATAVGPVVAAHGVTPATTSNYVLLQRSTMHAPPMPVTCKETRTALVIQSPGASPALPNVADSLFSKIDTNRDGVITRSEWQNALK